MTVLRNDTKCPDIKVAEADTLLGKIVEVQMPFAQSGMFAAFVSIRDRGRLIGKGAFMDADDAVVLGEALVQLGTEAKDKT